MSTVMIPLWARGGTVRAHALVDLADFERFGHLRWHMSSTGYAIRRSGGRGGFTTRLHRAIVGLDRDDPREVDDHINRDKLDNRRCNLRVVTHAQNGQNAQVRTDNTSGYRGVAYRKDSQKWMAYANVDGRRTYLGHHVTAEEAAAAALAFRREHTVSHD